MTRTCSTQFLPRPTLLASGVWEPAEAAQLQVHLWTAQAGVGVARRSVQGALSREHSSVDQAIFRPFVRTTPQLRSLSDFQGPTSASSSSTKKARVRNSAGVDRRCSQGDLSQVHSSADQANFPPPRAYHTTAEKPV